MIRRRLSMLKSCATCGIRFRPFKRVQFTCSHTCRAIREAKLHPERFDMVKPNEANAERQAQRLAIQVEGLTPSQAYQKGYRRGYATCHQRQMRRERRSA